MFKGVGDLWQSGQFIPSAILFNVALCYNNVPSSQANTITPVPSTSNDPQLPQQLPKQQKVKKTLTDISRRFSKRILLKKQKDGNNQGQETVKGKQKKKDFEM